MWTAIYFVAFVVVMSVLIPWLNWTSADNNEKEDMIREWNKMKKNARSIIGWMKRKVGV